ncbi:TIM44-like domain-containing protein [Mesorhizobium sp. Cs1330R2N1]|uniref:TIM44-like domain-containing protein n=1 Tax=Mesorhizobium argentiipisi TaxID=3015175 RepID=A0ABU8K8A0_9HYPH
MIKPFRFLSMLLILTTAFGILSVNPSEARRGGSFGSRGSRTYQAPAPTATAPSTMPVQRSMTPNRPSPASPMQPSSLQTRPSFWSGFGGGLVGGLIGGLVFNGIFGMLFGHGFGGLGGGFSFILQLLLIGGLIMLALRFFSRNNGSAAAVGSGFPFGQQNYGTGAPAYTAPLAGAAAAYGASKTDEIGITQNDLATFERLLADVQAAFTREDHQGLRRLTTPEMVSYLSEELADNATRGLKNEVSNLRFLNGEVAEAWREGTRDYATVALHWSAVDVMRNRQTSAIADGDPVNPVETTELWTFTREAGGEWLLSAIQDITKP